MKKCYLLFFAVLLGIALCGIPSVYAQGDASDEFVLEEITVTAQKRAESAQKVPIAMEIISGAEITELGMNDIDEILQGVANTIIEKTQDGYRVNIRGITDNSMPWKAQSMGAPAVGINLDGVYSNKKDTGQGLFDIERVEVLYGPQSTMYSSNSPGGIVNVVTATPKLDKYEGSGSIEYGSYNLVHTEGVMNAPLGDIMAIRAAFYSTKRDAYVGGTSTDDEDIRSLRLRTLIQPNDNLSFVITGENIRNKSQGFGGGVLPFDTQDGHWYQEIREGVFQREYEDLGPVTDPWTGGTQDKVYLSDQITDKIYAQVTYDTAVGTIALTPSYSERNGSNHMEIQFGPDIEETYMDQYVEEKSFEIKMNSPEDFPFKWVAGATYYDFFDQNIDESQAYKDAGPAWVLIGPGRGGVGLSGMEVPEGTEGATYFEKWGRMSDRAFTNKAKSYYINVTYPVTDAFRATLGYRQSWDKFETANHEIKSEPQGMSYAFEPFLMENPGDPDYRVGVEYDVGNNSMLYATYATSYRLQGMGGGGPPGSSTQVDPEELTAYTVGAKNRFLDNRLQVNAAVYYYDYRNYRAGGNDTEIWLNDDNGNGYMDGGFMSTESARDDGANGTGDGRVIGLDLSANWIITPNDRLNLTAAYMKSEWTDLIIDYEYDFTGGYNDQGVFDPELIPLPNDDFSGEEMMSAPPWNFNLTYDHNFHLPNGGSIKAAFTVKYKTEFRLSWRKADYLINNQEAYHMEDFSLVYNSPGDKLSLSAYVKNIEDYAEKRSLMNASGWKLMSIGSPRTIGGVLSIKY